MYDWLKLVTYEPDTKNFLLGNDKLNFTTKVNTDTGEVETLGNGTVKQTATHHGLEFNVFSSGRIEIKGSLHTFHNIVTKGVAINCDLFTYSDAVQAIGLLKTMYGVIPDKTTVHNLETGVNVMPGLDISVVRILDYFKAYKHLKFNGMDIRTEGKGKRVTTSQYKVKVYDKGTHQDCGNDILRYEIGYFKMQAVGHVLTLQDLIKHSIWDDLSSRLVSSLDNVLFTDVFNEKDLTVPERKLFTFCNNSDDWEQAKKDKRSKAKPRFDQMITTKGKYKFGNLFTYLLRKQIRMMTVKSGNLFTEVAKDKMQPFYHLSIGEKGCHSTFPARHNFRLEKAGVISYEKCRVTGLSMERETSVRKKEICIGISTIKWLRVNDTETYNFLCAEYLSKAIKGLSSKEPSQDAKLAKQIRNEWSNSKKYRSNVFHRYPEEQLSIFD